MKEDKYTKALPRIRSVQYYICDGYSEKRLTQIYRALYGDAMFVSLSGAQMWPPETNRNVHHICF